MAKSQVTRQEVTAIFGRLLKGEISPAEAMGRMARLKMGREVVILFLLERLQRETGTEPNLAGHLLSAVEGRRAKELLDK